MSHLLIFSVCWCSTIELSHLQSFRKYISTLIGSAPILCQSGKRKGKKKGASSKDIGKDFRIPPAVSFLQCQICLAEGLVMVILLANFTLTNLEIYHFFHQWARKMPFQILAGAWDYFDYRVGGKNQWRFLGEVYRVKYNEVV